MTLESERAGQHPSMGNELVVVVRLLKDVVKHPSGMFSFITGRGEVPLSASIDIAANCNLRCQHCYLYGKDHQEEGIADEMFLEAVKQFKKDYPAVLHCAWVGGEPLLRKEVLRKCVGFFQANWVVTNGTIPIDGKWPNTSFNISIDGTEEIHNQIRQPWKSSKQVQSAESPMLGEKQEASLPVKWNVYQRAKQNANKSTAPVYVHTVINQLNMPVISELVAEWKETTTVRGFVFSLHTPQFVPERKSGMTENDERLFIPLEQRRDVVAILHRLKSQYGKFIIMTPSEIENYLPERLERVFDTKCRVVGTVVSMDAKFQRKTPCVMGEGIDCSKCGCIVPAIMERVKSFDREVI